MLRLKKEINLFFKSYIRDKTGSFASMFAILAVPLLISAGMAVDISRQQSYKTVVQDAVDAAAIHAVLMTQPDEDELSASSRSAFEANLSGGDFIVTDFKVSESSDGSMIVTAHGKMNAMFAQIGGYPKLEISAIAQAIAEAPEDLELAIAFDTSSSLGRGNSWNTTIDTLQDVLLEIEEYSASQNFYASLVPFTDRVNVGTSNDQWLTSETPRNWNGCVEPRERASGDYKWALDDAQPTEADKFSASVPGVTGGLVKNGKGYPFCPSVAVTAPTTEVHRVVSAAKAMTKNGTGRADVGMAWAWRMMSPKWNSHWAKGGQGEANGDKRRRIALMITDGQTDAYTYELSRDGSWGRNKGSKDGFENLAYICERMQNDGMEIFMLQIAGNDKASPYLKNCASGGDHYYKVADRPQMDAAFDGILKTVKSNVRLAH
jgi:hypothetical protein